MKLPWTGSKKRPSGESGGLVTSIGVGVGSTAMVPVSQQRSPSRSPGKPGLTTTRMDEEGKDPPNGRFKLDR